MALAEPTGGVNLTSAAARTQAAPRRDVGPDQEGRPTARQAPELQVPRQESPKAGAAAEVLPVPPGQTRRPAPAGPPGQLADDSHAPLDRLGVILLASGGVGRGLAGPEGHGHLGGQGHQVGPHGEPEEVAQTRLLRLLAASLRGIGRRRGNGGSSQFHRVRWRNWRPCGDLG